MNTAITPHKPGQSASAMVLTMIMSGIALAILAGAMTWSANSTKLTHRSIQHARSIAAAEAATEKVLSRMTRDYLTGGEKLVADNLDSYRNTVPTSSDSPFWGQWEFNDAAGNSGRTFIQLGMSGTYGAIGSTFSGLRGFMSIYNVVSHARETATPQNVVAGVFQEVKLTRIPIFQFAMYSSGDMEISCGQPFAVTGQVHANKTLYVEPDNALTFQSDVTAVTDIVFHRHPDDPRGTPPGTPGGTVVYEQPDLKKSPVAAMTLPIGTNNSPEAIREIIQPPPFGEDSSLPISNLRYYNQADMLIVVTATNVTATSGRFNNFTTVIPTNDLAKFVVTNRSFWDGREEKTIRPIDINIKALTEWSTTNQTLGPALASAGSASNLSSIYVLDRRTLSGANLGAVRVFNGTNLPPNGLTVATARPLYVWGHYNQTNAANLATTNTTSTRPASLVADAVTILSANWSDANSTDGLSSRGAKPTTVNAAILTGVVETTPGKYSGGMENFPRFLESWGKDNPLTYNGSMVKMFPSLYATNAWGKKDVYDPPKRDWAYDLSFNNPSRLPPLTPCLVKVFRGQWATVAPDKNTVAVVP